MAHELRFLASTLPNVSWPELLERYRHIEALGFDIAGVADHFVDWNNPQTPWFEAWTLLAAVARETRKIRLALVTQIPFRNPALLARQALTVDHISDGRLELGLGIGLTLDPAYQMMGMPNWSAGERVARFKEYVEIVDRLLTNEVTTYEGRFYRVDGAVMSPRPVQQPRPPILIAAMGPRMVKHAARYADNWNSTSHANTFDQQLAETRDHIRRINEECAAIGRDPVSLRRSYWMFDTAARLHGGLFRYYGSKDIFAEMAERLIDLGISEIGVYYPMRPEQVPMFERIARDVIPELKRKHAANRRA
jgi:alkanesulfonate monooxygenase SsuD/methylene tetrahydromethanopterin reductase-like flavin-dependent oxidoreductase (luciferase family)